MLNPIIRLYFKNGGISVVLQALAFNLCGQKNAQFCLQKKLMWIFSYHLIGFEFCTQCSGVNRRGLHRPYLSILYKLPHVMVDMVVQHAMALTAP